MAIKSGLFGGTVWRVQSSAALTYTATLGGSGTITVLFNDPAALTFTVTATQGSYSHSGGPYREVDFVFYSDTGLDISAACEACQDFLEDSLINPATTNANAISLTRTLKAIDENIFAFNAFLYGLYELCLRAENNSQAALSDVFATCTQVAITNPVTILAPTESTAQVLNMINANQDIMDIDTSLIDEPVYVAPGIPADLGGHHGH